MNETNGNSTKLIVDRVAFGISFVVISITLCNFVHIPVLLYLALVFLSTLVGYPVSIVALRVIDRVLEILEERRKQTSQGPKTP
jgi:uncharacterized membrane protein